MKIVKYVEKNSKHHVFKYKFIFNYLYNKYNFIGVNNIYSLYTI